MKSTPEVKYARNGKVSLAYSIWGEGEEVVVFTPPLVSNVELMWELPEWERLFDWVGQHMRVQTWWNRFERQSCSPGSLLTMVRAMTQFDVASLLGKIRSPTLVCHASGDRVAHIAEGRTLAALIPKAEFKAWDNPNHLWGFGTSWRDHENDLIEFFTASRPPSGSTKAFGCILFTDIVGSTKLATQMGDSQWRSVLELHDSVSRAGFHEFGGTEIKRTGDGFLVVFQSPFDAARSALKIVSDLEGSSVSIRVGIHIGQIEAHDDGDVSGIAVNIASRVQSLADPGEVLVSQTVREILMGSGLTLSDRGTHALKGVDGSWTVYSLVG